MAQNSGLFGKDLESKNKRTVERNNWYLISNSLNLSFIISNGLIIQDYGTDLNHAKAGWITLYPENNITSDSKHETIIIKINTSYLAGPVFANNSIGEFKEMQFPEELDGDEKVISIPGPLPITCISEIHFPSKESKEDYLDRAAGRKNEKLDASKLKVKKPPKNLQKKISPTNLPPREADPKLLDEIRIAAAIRGLFFKFANREEKASIMYNKVYSSSELIVSSDMADLDPILKELGVWLKRGDISSETKEDVNKRHVNLFWKIINSIVNSGAEQTAYDIVINELDKSIEIMENSKEKIALTNLRTALFDIRNVSTKSVDELFKEFPKPFSRALIIFFINEKAFQFVKYKNNELKLDDLLVASLLCGARENWTSFPSEIKGTSLFINEQSNFMARMFHERANTKITIKTPNNILPLYDLLLGEDSNTKKHEEMSVWIAKEMDWKCVEYKILAKRSDKFTMEITGKGMEFSSASPIFSLSEKVTPEFSKYLAEEYIESSVEEKIREKLK